jgi:hypothetical protein
VETDYDKAFKILIDFSPADWAIFSGLSGIDYAEGMETDIPARNKYVDRLIRITDQQGVFALHLEFQAGKSGNRVPVRLLDYSIGITERHRLPVHSCVVLLSKSADSPVLTGTYKQFTRGVLPYLMFSYRVHRLWMLPLETFLIPGSSLAAAGVLADYGGLTSEAVGARITECVSQIADIDTREMVLSIAYSLAGMRFNDGRADIMFGRNLEMLERSSVIQATLRRGEARLLLTSAEQIFGAPSQEILDKVRNAKSKKLVEWTVRMRTAQSWAELVTD